MFSEKLLVQHAALMKLIVLDIKTQFIGLKVDPLAFSYRTDLPQLSGCGDKLDDVLQQEDIADPSGGQIDCWMAVEESYKKGNEELKTSNQNKVP